MAGFKTWVPGEEVLAADLQGFIQDQVFAVFTSTAQRDAQWPTPPDGARAYTTDTNTAWLRRSGAWVAWPESVVALTKLTVSSGAVAGVELVVSGGTIFWTAVAGRRYKISWAGLLQGSVAGDTAFLRLRQTSSTGPQIGGVNVHVGTAAIALSYSTTTFLGGVAGGQTVVFTLQRNTGTGTITNVAAAAAPTFLWVEDAGAGSV